MDKIFIFWAKVWGRFPWLRASEDRDGFLVASTVTGSGVKPIENGLAGVDEDTVKGLRPCAPRGPGLAPKILLPRSCTGCVVVSPATGDLCWFETPRVFVATFPTLVLLTALMLPSFLLQVFRLQANICKRLS